MKKWLINCNLKGYDILGKLLKDGFVNYKINGVVAKNDEVYIYAVEPLNAIFLKCRVKEILNEEIEESLLCSENNNISTYVRIEVVKNYLSIIDKVNKEALIENGLIEDNFQFEVNGKLNDYLDSLEDELVFIN